VTDVQSPTLPSLPPPWHSAEREALQQQARAFARDEVLPVANELDPVKGVIPAELLARIGELGYFGITIDREHGGLGLGAFEYCMVAEELARAWMSVASIIARAQGLGTGLADAAERQRLLRRSAKGEWIGAIALSEPEAGSDLASVQTRAVREGDEWVVTGQKRWCGNAKAADFIQLLVRTRDPEAGESRSAGLEALLLRKPRGEFVPGLTGTPIDKIGYHGFLTWDLDLNGVRIPADSVVTSGEQEGGFSGVGAWLDVARVHTAARALYRQVAHLLDEGVECTRQAAMAKLRASEMAAVVTTQAMQLHGGNGYTTERQVERHWRDARLTTIFEGTSEIQRKIISDSMLPRPQS